MMDRIVNLLSVDDILRVEVAWRELAQRSTPHSMAQTYEYALAAMQRAHETSTKAFLAVVEDDERIIGIAGFTLTRRSLHWIVEPFTNGSHEEGFRALVEAGREVEVSERMLRLVTSGKADRVMLYAIDPDGAYGGASIKLGRSYRDSKIDVLEIPAGRYPTWASVEKTLAKGIRAELRRRSRRLEELDPTRKLKIHWRETPEACDQAIDFFIEHKLRWAADNKKSSRWLAEPDGLVRFFKNLSRTVDLSETPIIVTIDLGDTPIAAALCLVSTSHVEYAFTTYDQDFAKFGPGKLLLPYLIEWSLTRKRDFSFGVLAATYKEEWPVERHSFVTRQINMSVLGAIQTPAEVTSKVRRSLGPYKRKLFSLIGRDGDKTTLVNRS